MNGDFDRFLRACKEWPTSQVVREVMGRMWPTYLLETASNELVFGEFVGGNGRRTPSQIRKELSRYLTDFRPTAFAVILPLEDDSLRELEAALTDDHSKTEAPEPWSEYYLQAVLVQAFAIDGSQITLLGLAEGELETSIDRWVQLPEVSGQLAEAVDAAAVRWRESEASAALD